MKKEEELNIIHTKIISLLSLYSFDKLYLWLAGTAVIPENQDKPMRFEIIMACLLSIPENKFKNVKLTYNEFNKLIEKIDSLIYPLVISLEDYHPYPQMKKIPLFLPEGIRYFLYGTYEYPYFMWKKIIDTCYPSLEKHNSPIYYTIKKSLQFQTHLVEVFDKYNLSEIKQRNIFIPSIHILNEIATFFVVDNYENNTRICRSGDFTEQKDIITYALQGNLYEILYVKHKNKIYYWLPFDHFDGISHALNKTISKNSFLREELEFKSKQNFFEHLFSRGRINNLIKNIFSISKKCLSETIDYISMVDEKNLLLFKYVPIVDLAYLEEAIQTANVSLQNTIEEITKQDLVFFEDNNYDCYGAPKINYWGIVVIDIFLTNEISVNIKTDDHIVFYLYDDLCYFFDHINNFYELLQFFIDDHTLQKQGCISLDSISRFDFYINNKGFSNAAMSIFLYFDPHYGSMNSFENIYKSFQNPIYEKAYYLLGNKYKLINKQSVGDGFDICDRNTGAGGIGTVISNKLFFIQFPWDDLRYVPQDIMEVCCKILGPLILDYVSKLGDEIIQSCKNMTINILPDLFRIDLIPKEIANNTFVFNDYIEKISEELPIATKVIAKGGKCYTAVIYDANSLPKYFNSYSDNGAERKIILQIFTNIISIITEENEDISSTLLNNIWDKVIGVQNKGYNMTPIQIIDPIVKSYPSPVQIDIIEQNHIQKEIASFVFKQKIKPGKYLYHEANEICNSIFGFLWNRLINTLSLYNFHSIYFIYREIELVYYQRESLKTSIGLQSKIRTEYDLSEHFKEELLTVQQLNDTVNYLFHVFYSLGTYGNQHLTEVDWRKCLALGWWLNEVSYISDSLHFDTANFELTVSELYEISLNYIDSQLDYSAFQKKQIISTINYESQRMTQRISHNEDNEDTTQLIFTSKSSSWLEEIDKAFVNDFNFSFSLLQSVENSLLNISSENMDFPILIFNSKEELCNKIYEKLIVQDSQLSQNSICSCIDFLTSLPVSLKNSILPSDIRMHKSRLNISPLFCDGDKYLYGKQIVSISNRVLYNYLSSGIQPFDLSSYTHTKQCLDAIHKDRDKELENKIYQISCKILGKDKTLKNIKNFQSISPSLETFPECGEIDLLAVNFSIKIVYVIDAKNQQNAKYPSGIHREINKFFGNKGHVEQLNKKAQYIAENLNIILQYFKIDSLIGWKIQKAFVSDKMFISGFLEGNEIDFIDISELEQYLKTGQV